MAEQVAIPRWAFEWGVREKGPQDSDYDPTSLYVERVRTGNARFTCAPHYDTGWQPIKDTTRLARDHLAEHGVELPWGQADDG